MGLSSKQVCDDQQQLFDNWSFQEPPPKLPTTVKRQQNHHHNQPPAPALNCPRCDSSNTKFCYYNNYNKSQPRHFCKSCKRHWTNGGTLRNVPIGGGRKNKRRKSSPQATTAASNNNNNNQIIMSSRVPQSSLCLYKSADDSNLLYQAISTSTHNIDRDRQSSAIFDVENVMNYLPSTTNEFSWSSNSTTTSSNMNIGTSEGGIIGDDVCWEFEPSSSSYWNWNVGFDVDDHTALMLGGSEGGGGGGGGFNDVVLSNWDEMDHMIKP